MPPQPEAIEKPFAVDTAGALDAARGELSRVWLGDPFVIDLLLTAVIGGGHILLEDIPGVGKTTLAKGLARTLGLNFNRVQFTNDILPADILGGSVYNPADGTFSFAPGPVFTDFLLADEINRAPTRSQSAFLQAMEEGQVAVDGVGHPLSELFTVIATQNPIDFDSTNPLPEAQLDRFLVATTIGYPDRDAELQLLGDYSGRGGDDAQPVTGPDEVLSMRAQAAEIFLHEDLARYIVALARASRDDERLKLGISPRGALHLAQAVKSYALVQGADAVSPDMIQRLIHPVWSHRLLPRHGRDHNRGHAAELLDEYIEAVPVPR